jgi:hypothetical protein
MDEVCSVACPMTAGSASIAATRDTSRALVRWVVLGAASLVLFVLAAAHSASVGAATPATYDGNYCINFYTCYSAPTTVAPAASTTTGYPANVVVSTYVDARYCGGIVSVVTDSTGHLIDVCPGTGQRIVPIYPDYGAGFAPGFLGANFINGNFVNGFNGNFANGFYGNFGNGFNGNLCNVNVNCLNTFPAGGTVVGGVVFYNDNRFCTDGKLAFVPGRGYFCQNGGPLVTNGAATVNCSNFFFNGCGIWRGFEADAAPATQPQQVTAFAAPAAKAPVVAPAAPVVAPAAPVIAPAAVVAPAAPVVAPAAPVTAKAATALNAPVYVPVGSTVDPSDRG